MGRKPQQIRWEAWTLNAIDDFAEKTGKNFSEAVRFLVEVELVARGYNREDWEPGIPDEVKRSKSIQKIEKKAT